MGLARYQLAAAGFEAACRLGRFDERLALPPELRTRLRENGDAAWMDRIETTWAHRLTPAVRMTVRERARSRRPEG
jgi:hypothetical protein